MTDEPDSVDELISRYLDGEATEDEIARVERDPVLLARAESMRAAIEAVAQPVTIPALDLDRIRVAAIAESTTTPQVTDLMAAGAERRRHLERRNRIMAGAAAFVILAVGVVAVQSIDSGDDDAETADTSAIESGDSATATDDAADGDDSDDLGAFATESDDTASADSRADDDMAEEDEEAPAAEAAPEMDDSAGAADAADEEEAVAESAPVLSRDLLPDELPPVASAGELVDLVLSAYAEPFDADAAPGLPTDDVVAGLCDEAVALLTEALPPAVTSIETLVVEIGGVASSVIVGSDVDGGVAILSHPLGDCAAVALIG